MNLWNAMNKKIAMAVILFASLFVLIACGGSTKEYIVTFNSMGGSAVEAITIEDGKTLDLPTNPNRTGYTFDNWYLEESLTTPFTNLVITENITVYAKWTINTYTVTFNTDGGSAISNVSVNYNQILTPPTAPTKTGYTFAGWYTDANKTNIYVLTTPITQNLTLYAAWTINTFYVNFDEAGGSEVQDVTIDYNQPVTQPANPTKVGHTFAGWFTDVERTNAYVFSSLVTQNITLYAKYEVNTYTVNFVLNGGTAIEAQNVLYEEKLETVNPLYTGHAFMGWFYDEELTLPYADDDLITEDITLYAKWEVIPPTDEELAWSDIQALGLPDSVNSDMTLPTTGANGTKFVWSSNKPHLITSTGRVLPAGYGSGGEVVILSATVTKGTYSSSISFEIIVDEAPESLVTSTRNVNFINVSTEYFPSNGNIDLFFMNNQDVPFVDISAFMFLVDGAINTIATDPVTITGDDGELYDRVQYVTFEMIDTDIMAIRYIIEYSQLGAVVETNIYEAILDFTDNTFYTDSFDFFDAMVASTSTNFGEGLSFGDSIVTEGTGIFIPLSKYRFDLVIHEDGEDTFYLMPLHVANLLFVGSVYFDVYYNGDALYGVDSYQFLRDSPVVITAKTSSYNALSASLAMKVATYDYLVLIFDYFYGLKDVNGIETYYDVFGKFVNNLIYGRDTGHYRAIYDLTYSLDDLHTYHITTGYYVETDFGYTLTLNDLGPRSAGYYQGSWAVRDAANAVFPDGRPSLRVTPDGKTAIIVIDSFTVDTPNLFKLSLEELAAEYPLVENVIVDLTRNGGGNVGAVWRTLGYMWDDVIYYHSQNPTEGSAVTYQIYDTYPSYDYNWFILTSSVTFSAANLMASTAKEQGIATIIGLNSTGGASSISGTVLPTGDVIFISSTNVISTLVDGEYVSVEYGVQVDYSVGNVNNLYNDTYLQELIQTINQNNAE
jgi:uncharacterized repeat protein (TIGR02543 family)